MKIVVLFAIFIFINAIAPSDSAHCQCACCRTDADNPDCQVASVGTVPVTDCDASMPDCIELCKQNYQTQCGTNETSVVGTCIPDAISTATPSITTVINGPFECKCMCCSTANCTTTDVGNVIADKCALCPAKCTEQYPSQCGSSTTSEVVECRPYTSVTTVTKGTSVTAVTTTVATTVPSGASIGRQIPSFITLLLTLSLFVTKIMF